MPRLRIASIGAGSAPGARTWGFLEAITALGDMYELCAIVDRDRERAQAAADAFGGPPVFTEMDAMLAAEAPDVVLRLTPTDSALAVCVRAARAGCHVINEIPLELTLPRADMVIEACREACVQLEVAENVWLWPQEQLKRRIVSAGLLGTLTHMRLTYPCGAYHGFNAIRMATGLEPTRVLGYAGEVPVEDMDAYGGGPMNSTQWESALIQFEGGVDCLYELPPKRPVWRHNWDIEGTRGYLSGDTLTLYENRQEVCYPIEPVWEERDGGAALSCVRVNTDPPVVWENPFARYGISDTDQIAKAAVLESMYRAVVEGAQPRYGAANARRDIEIDIALRESALRGGVWVDLPLAEMTQFEHRMHAEWERHYGCDPLGDLETQLSLPYTRHSVMWTVAGWL